MQFQAEIKDPEKLKEELEFFEDQFKKVRVIAAKKI